MNKAVSANSGEFHTEVCVENICIQKSGSGKVQDLPWNAVKMYISGKRRRSIMATITMEVPQEALPFFEIKDAVLLNEQRALMMFPFVKNGVLSRGRVAELLGMNKFDLISIYQRFGMPFIDSPIEDLEEDIANCEMAMDRG